MPAIRRPAAAVTATTTYGARLPAAPAVDCLRPRDGRRRGCSRNNDPMWFHNFPLPARTVGSRGALGRGCTRSDLSPPGHCLGRPLPLANRSWSCSAICNGASARRCDGSCMARAPYWQSCSSSQPHNALSPKGLSPGVGLICLVWFGLPNLSKNRHALSSCPRPSTSQLG